MAGKKKPNTYALTPSNHPISVAWRVDYDYTKKLSPEDKLYLAAFTDSYYTGDFRASKPEDWPIDKRRASYTQKNTANSDCYHGLEHEKLLSGLDAPLTGQRTNNFTRLMRGQERSNIQKVADTVPSLPIDANPTPAYLNSPEYKEALVNYRKTLNPGRRECAPKDTPAYHSASETLNKIVKSHV